MPADPLPPANNLFQRMQQTRRARLHRRLERVEWLTLGLGATGALLHAGFISAFAERVRELGGLALLVMGLVTLSRLVRAAMPVSGLTGSTTGRLKLLMTPVIWLTGCVILFFWQSADNALETTVVTWTEIVIAVQAAMAVLRGFRALATMTHNSAVLLMGSFLTLIAIGTLLLMTPASRAAQAVPRTADWHVALFTATSASCVTGLIVEPTGSYWSPFGHAVIFALFQVGGLGILTFGAFVAVLSGRRGLEFREARTLGDMLDSHSLQDSRRLLLTILLCTLGIELIGAALLSGLWSDLPVGQQIWQAVFHSVSAFCNAGFSLQDDGFLNMGTRWQVFGPLTVLIILGGLGFPVIQDVFRSLRRNRRQRSGAPLFRRNGIRRRLSIHSRLVLWSAAVLLVTGAVNFFFLESLEPAAGHSVSRRAADAWFQSVTFRTAGFNTVDHAAMSSATKLMAIVLMFIGAAPGSTGGGVKTVVFAITVLNVYAVLQGRDRVEVFGRCIPTEQVSRALSMIAVGLLIVLLTTGLLVIFEPESTPFLDVLYEATSAFGTVGVSTGITGALSVPSRLVIVVVMFVGRVGPITLLLAMAGGSSSHKYSYPTERVSLG